jgi:hypothetical protein
MGAFLRGDKSHSMQLTNIAASTRSQEAGNKSDVEASTPRAAASVRADDDSISEPGEMPSSVLDFLQNDLSDISIRRT